MNIPTEIALWMQKRLLGVNNEEWGLTYMASGNAMAKHTNSDWQVAVDLVYSTLVCDLIDVHWFVECDDKPSLLIAIRKFNPFHDSGWRLWNITQIHGTERLSALIEAHFPPGVDRRSLNPAFIEALERIFAENGVPWSDKPLLPIMPAGAEASAPR